MKRLLALVCFGFVVFGSHSASAACMPFVRWMNGQTVDGYMTVRSGGTCDAMFRSLGPTSRTVILARPSNGSVSVDSIGRITYKAREGYVGNDTFTYARRGMTSRNTPMNATVRVSVRVTP